MSFVVLNNEGDLLKEISNGNKKAFATIFNAHYQSLASYVFKLTESMEVTEEIVQDVFIKIWLKRENLQQINSFANYIFILSKNQTLNYLRKKANDELRRKNWEKETDGGACKENEDEQLENFRVLVEKAIDQLPEQQKRAYLLSRNEKLKYEEIACRLKISPETVKKHIYLASRCIKDYVKTHMDEVVIMILLSQIAIS